MIKRIVVSGGWGYGNIGDEAILKYTILDIKMMFENYPLTIFSFCPGQTKYHHGQDSEENLHRLLKKNVQNDFKAVCMEIINNRNIPDFLDQYVSYFNSETLFVMAGGGYFNDLWKESFYAHLCEIVIAKARGAKIAIIGQTIGPIGEKKDRGLFSRIVRSVDYVDVRDETSYLLLSELLPGKTVYLSCDAVIRNGNWSIRKKDSKQIAIMYQRKRPYTNSDSSLIKYRISQGFQLLLGESRRFEKHFCALIRKIREKYPDYKIVFIQSTNWNENRIKQIVKKSGADGVIFDTRVDDYLKEISKSCLVITTNMHPAIIATSIGIPAIAISHTYKIDDYMSSISMDKYVYHNADVRRIIAGIDELLNENGINDNLTRCNARLNLALDNTYGRLKEICKND